MADLTTSFLAGRREGIALIIVNAIKKWVTRYPEFTKVFNTTKVDELFYTHGAYPSATVRPEGEEVEFVSRISGVSKRITPVEFNIADECSDVGEETLQYAELKNRVPWMVKAYMNAQEKEAADAVFNNGFSSETCADGRPLYDTAHPLLGGGTFANEPTAPSALDPFTLQSAITDLMSQPDEYGNPNMLTETDQLTLFGGRSLLWTIREVLDSPGRAYTPDNTKNVIDNIIGKIVPHISGTPWFLQHAEHETQRVVQGKNLTQRMDFDHKRHMNQYQVYGRFKTGTPEPRYRYGNEGP